MEARFVNFRGTHKRKKGNQMVIDISGVNSKEKAQALVGKTVTWTSPGKEKKQIKGKISAIHGNKGCVRALFEKGLPGQSLGEKVQIE